jgi:hypothetical protein
MGFIYNSASGFSDGVSHARAILSKTAVEGIKRQGRVSNPPLMLEKKMGADYFNFLRRAPNTIQ